jgi:ABC-type multidrug transport system fused ATPase/permease subunit
MRFLSTLGLLPGTWLNLFIITLSGIIEGIGITLFIPLLQLMNDQSLNDIEPPFTFLIATIEKTGLNIDLVSLLMLIAGFSLLALFLGYLQRKLMIRSKQLYAHSLRQSYYNGVLDSKWGFSSTLSHGEAINQVTTECTRAAVALWQEVLAVASAIQIIFYLGFSMLISWQLIIVTAIFGGLAYFLVRPIMRKAKGLGHETSTANRNLSFYVIEYLRSLKIIKATASMNQVKVSLSSHNQTLYSVSYQSELNTAQVYFLIQALPVLLLTLIIGLSIEFIDMPTSLIMVFLLFMARTAPRVAQFQQQYHTYSLCSPAIRIVRDTIEKSLAAHENLNTGGKVFQNIETAIKLDEVSYHFPDEKQLALSNVSMVIPRNKMIAIVGRSGAGKSTVMDILTGLRRPSTGKLLFDGTELGKFNLTVWRQHIGIVTQDTMIFNASLRENLLFFAPDATDVNIASAITIAHLNEVVAELPKGLDTILGEGSIRLSGGQKQRVALARALVGKPELLLLDEATSALDNESERFVQNAIEHIAHTMTIVVIAHRLSTVRRADMIYVMEKGAVVETGSYDELLSKGGLFKELQGMELS